MAWDERGMRAPVMAGRTAHEDLGVDRRVRIAARRRAQRRKHSARGIILASLMGATVAGVLHARGALPATSVPTDPPTSPVAVVETVAPWTVSTSTTADPGTLPQTNELPRASGAQFDNGVSDLWRAVVQGDPQQAMPFFFPLSAYAQVKGISDPVHDFETRLLPAFRNDILSLHRQLGPDAARAQLVSLTVPDAAQWILPGTEYNKGSYWRVFGNRLTYRIGGVERSFPVYSLISWRGQWYVVHIGPPTT